jgi:hypothetical protein
MAKGTRVDIPSTAKQKQKRQKQKSSRNDMMATKDPAETMVCLNSALENKK